MENMKNMKNLLFLIIGLLCSSNILMAQLTSLFPWQAGMRTYINPASPSEDRLDKDPRYFSLNLAYRQQWQQTQGPQVPSLRLAYYPELSHQRFSMSGFGIHALRIDTDPILQNRIQSQLMLGIGSPDKSLSIGFSPGFINYRLKIDSLDLIHSDDPLLFGERFNNWKIVGGVGIFWHQKFGSKSRYPINHYYIGFSIPQINFIETLSTKSDFEISLRNAQSYYLQAGGVLEVPQAFRIESTVWVKKQTGVPIHIDGIARLVFMDEKKAEFWLGLGYSNTQVFHFESGFADLFTIPLKIGIGYDYSMQKYQSVFGSTVELSLSWDFQYNH